MYVVFPHKSNRVVGEHLRASLECLFEDAQARPGPAACSACGGTGARAAAAACVRCCPCVRAAAGSARQAAPGGDAEHGAAAQCRARDQNEPSPPPPLPPPVVAVVEPPPLVTLEWWWGHRCFTTECAGWYVSQ